MMITRQQYEDVEKELRTLLDSGMLLGHALRHMHHQRHVGQMLLWPAVMAVRQVDKQEAMRIVVHETSPWRDDGGYDQ